MSLWLVYSTIVRWRKLNLTNTVLKLYYIISRKVVLLPTSLFSTIGRYLLIYFWVFLGFWISNSRFFFQSNKRNCKAFIRLISTYGRDMLQLRQCAKKFTINNDPETPVGNFNKKFNTEIRCTPAKLISVGRIEA